MRLTEKNHSSFAKRLLKIALSYFAVFQVKIIDPERWQEIGGQGLGYITCYIIIWETANANLKINKI